MLLNDECITTYRTDIDGRRVIDKDADAELDYGVDFTRYLAKVANDTISSLDVIVDTPLVKGDGATASPKGITHPAPTHDGVSVSAWIWGGTVGMQLGVTFRITTAAGRVDDRTVYLNIVEK